MAAGADATSSITDARWAPNTRSPVQVYCAQQQERRDRESVCKVVSVGRSEGLVRAVVCGSGNRHTYSHLLTAQEAPSASLASATCRTTSDWRRIHHWTWRPPGSCAPDAVTVRTHLSKTLSSNSTFSPRCDFMTFWLHSFQTLSHGLRSFHSACFVFWILLEPLVSPSVSHDLSERFFVLSLQG